MILWNSYISDPQFLFHFDIHMWIDKEIWEGPKVYSFVSNWK